MGRKVKSHQEGDLSLVVSIANIWQKKKYLVFVYNNCDSNCGDSVCNNDSKVEITKLVALHMGIAFFTNRLICNDVIKDATSSVL